MDAIAIRLNPGEDLKPALLAYCIHHKINAAYILTGVGSLRQAMLRFADQPQGHRIEQKLEILALTGTLSQQGAHLHIAVSDHTGQIIGGHLMADSLIYTTAEIVIGVIPNLIFGRAVDPVTGYKELQIASAFKEG
ncbi:MAG: DNA-binding protein [Leptolyngbya sp. RL_3_1]|nr:DNA-binding protein [Leptolyngbya sp. RL_3_1]